MAEQGRSPKYVNKQDFFATLGKVYEDHEIAPGKTIKVRSLGLNEVAEALRKGAEDIGTAMKRICLLGIVEPELCLDDLEALEKAQGGKVYDIGNAILRLSGIKMPTPREGETVEQAVKREFDDFFEATRTPPTSTPSASSTSTGSPESSA